MGLTLVALAAGVGSRFGGLKQLEPVGPSGEALLEYSVYDAIRAGFSQVVLVVRKETESLFREAFANGMAEQIRTIYVHQDLEDLPPGFSCPASRTKPWGTGHAVLAAEPVVEGGLAVINADDFYGAESFAALSRFLTVSQAGEPTEFAMVGFRLGDTLSATGSVSRALCETDRRHRLERIVEVLQMWKEGEGGSYTDPDGRRVRVPGDAIVSMNCWGFTPDLFPELRARFKGFLAAQNRSDRSEFLVPEVVQALVREDRAIVQVLGPAGQWCGMTYPEDRERTAQTIALLVAQGEYPSPLWK